MHDTTKDRQEWHQKEIDFLKKDCPHPKKYVVEKRIFTDYGDVVVDYCTACDSELI